MDILVSGLRHILNVTNNKIYREGNSCIAKALYLKIMKKYNLYVIIKSGRETRFWLVLSVYWKRYCQASLLTEFAVTVNGIWMGKLWCPDTSLSSSLLVTWMSVGQVHIAWRVQLLAWYIWIPLLKILLHCWEHKVKLTYVLLTRKPCDYQSALWWYHVWHSTINMQHFLKAYLLQLCDTRK